VNPEIALQFARTALIYSEKSKNDTLISSSILYLGTALHIMGAYDSAMVYYEKAEKKFVELKDNKRMGTIYLHLSSLFSDANDNTNAITYAYRSMSYFVKEKDTVNISAIYNNIGIYYDHDNRIDSTLHYYLRSLDLRKKYSKAKPEQRALNLSISYTNIGHLYQHKLKDFQKAIYYYGLASEEDKKHPDVLYKIATFENLASCFIDLKQYDNSVKTGLRGLQLANTLTNYIEKKYLFNSLANGYSGLKKHDSAFYYMQEYSIFIDSTYALETQKVVSEMQQKYDSEKKSIEIALLNKDKESADTFRKTLYLIIALILLVVIALIYSFVLKQRSNKSLVLKNNEINKQKHLVEEKQKEIIDSIHYAKRIQQSLMPTSKYISKKLDDLKK
jgi:tetratricopeptide (TPR) repeat protein